MTEKLRFYFLHLEYFCVYTCMWEVSFCVYVNIYLELRFGHTECHNCYTLLCKQRAKGDDSDLSA